MREKQSFFKCAKCGNIVGLIFNAGVPIVCCGREMQELVPNTVDASEEKHIPVVSVNGNKVEVHIGSVDHPMTMEHYIGWIYLETKQGGQRKILKPGDKPQATFILESDTPIAAYAYCNLHGLWETEYDF